MMIKASKAIMSKKATSGSHLSPCARNLFTMNQNVDSKVHLQKSRASFDVLHKEIHMSVSKGNIVHVEDGEADDLWHNLLGIQQGLIPQLVLLSGGYYKLQEKCAHIMWD
ncbi:hypothetical protein PCANC_03878 [Puccinia coronata f. sp. avenae]|uniref:Uncharacterized protein n=1 Tax=Puccinia coronata f. sp. avenae TaxID=200324 RepID=A0A2N5T5Z7_9BASI|nr:hypothetical protein PCANC_08644 [Puccinia coronata f. sp. avenae]PLW56040.1 hypothetical protein PCANC_03878 [Puccinia coronata f. sp. avenae]